MTPDDKDRDIYGQDDNKNIEAQVGAEDDDFMAGGDDMSRIEDDLDRDLARDNDDGGESGLDFDFPTEGKKSSGLLGRFLGPVVILAAALGLAGFVFLNPQMLGMKSADSLPAATPPQEAAATPDGSIALASSGEADISEKLPQPTATQNDADSSAVLTPEPPSVPGQEAAAVVEPAPEQEPVPVGSPDDAAAPDAPSAPTPVADVSPAQTEAAAPAALTAPDEAPESPVPSTAPPSTARMVDIAKDMRGDLSKTNSAMASEVPVPAADAPQPDQAKLQPAAPPPISPNQGAQVPAVPVDGSLAGTADSPLEKPAPNAIPVKDDDVYYDANIEAPTSGMATAVGPRKVDPNAEPGQKFVIVEGVLKADDVESIIVSASRALKLGRYDAALELYNALYAKNPRDPRILMGRAVAQQNLKMDDSAIHSYEELIAINPNNTDAMINLLGLIKNKSPSIALRRMIDLQGKLPSNAGLAAQIGVTEGEMGNYPEAMRYLGMAESLEPENPQHAFNMAVLADRQGKTADAIKLYETALEVGSVSAASDSIPRQAISDRLAVLRRR